MINSLVQLLKSMDVESQIFDMGRHIHEISQTTFSQCEDQTIPYPSPHLQSAWLGVIFWSADAPENPTIWFLKLPLDEQGKLVLSERDRLIQQLLIGAGKNLKAAKEGNQFEEVLKDNPFVFTPTPEKQAIINAKVRNSLKLGASQYLHPAEHYLTGDLNLWQELPLQGLADIVCRWADYQEVLINAITKMPTQPLVTLCQLLENETINSDLSEPLYTRLISRLDSKQVDDNSSEIIALIRGLSMSSELALRHKAIERTLSTDISNDTELLATISSRCQLDLLSPDLCEKFLTALAKQPENVFNTLLQNLLHVPILRPHIVANISQENTSPAVKNAFHRFTASIRKKLH